MYLDRAKWKRMFHAATTQTRLKWSFKLWLSRICAFSNVDQEEEIRGKDNQHDRDRGWIQKFKNCMVVSSNLFGCNL